MKRALLTSMWAAQGAAASGGSACAGVPSAYQIQGQYSGFAVWPGEASGSLADGALSARWKAHVEVLKATNKFWDTFAAKVVLQRATDDYGLSFVARGIRPTNSRSVVVRASQDPQSTMINTGWLSSMADTLFGVSPASSLPTDDDEDAFEFGTLTFLADENVRPGLKNGPASVLPHDGAYGPSGLKDGNDQISARCHITGLLTRTNAELERRSPDDPTFPDGVSPPLEGRSAYFQRSPDLVARFMFSPECITPHAQNSREPSLASPTVTLALRKFDPEFLADQKFVVGLIVCIKTILELVLYSRQFKLIMAQPVLLKTSPWTTGLSVLYDAFEAQFFFARQDGGEVLTILSSAGALKVLLVCVVEMRWLIMLWKERAIQRQNALNNMSPDAWLTDMNKGIRSSAALMVLVLLITSNAFAYYPEAILLSFAFYMMPQILKNAYDGLRHPLKFWFVAGIACCRAVLPFLLWSPKLDLLWRSNGGEFVPDENRYPPWFFTEAIPAEYTDMFGDIKRRPNSLALMVLVAVLSAQVLWLFLQSWWSPRIFIPHHISERYLPKVFDYELDVARAAAQRQEADPDCVGVDCVICFTNVKFADYTCVVTPCQHFFHKECLLQWMEVKLECPTCRRMLPPY